MNDLNRNTRTLIVCFVVAIFTLIPLKFYETGNQVVSKSEVLGVQRKIGVALPDSRLGSASVPVLEFPYEEIESAEAEVTDCILREEADKVIGNLAEILKISGLDDELVTAAMEEIERIEENVCR